MVDIRLQCDTRNKTIRYANMKAITYHFYGGPDVLNVEEVAVPEIGADEVLIRVRAAEATKADCEMRSFKFSVLWFWLPLRLALGITRPRRPILGNYFSGEVVETGSSVTQYAVGDEVYGSSNLRFGAYAEYLALKESATLTPKPQNFTFAEAAAVPLGGLNALHFLRLAKLQEGSTLLVNGAGGSIGAHAVQIAKAWGVTVTAVDAPHKFPFIQRMGADHLIDYTQTDFRDTDARYDAIFDMVPDSDYSGCLSILKAGGVYLLGNARLSSLIRAAATTRATDKTVRVKFAEETEEELQCLTDMIEAGKIRSIVDREVSMQDAAAAHRAVESERREGAIVITID